MADRLTPSDIRSRTAAHIDAVARAQVERIRGDSPYVRPLLGAAIDLIDWMSNPEGRLMFGLPEIDAAIRGVGRGELAYLTGRAHSGKTKVVLNMIRNNAKGRFLFFTPDEVDNLILTNLVALEYGIDAEELELRIKAGDQRARNLVYVTAIEHFPNLIIIDEALSFAEMSQAIRQNEDRWQAPCDGVFIDYLDLLPGDADYGGTKAKSTKLKRWCKYHRVPVVCIHQPKRGGAARGRSIGMDDMAQGGETEATFVLGVFRRREDPYASIDYIEHHRNTITVAIDKNKRPPCHVGEWDYFMDPRTALIRPEQPGDRVVPGVPILSLADATGHLTNRRRPTTEQVIDLAEHRGA